MANKNETFGLCDICLSINTLDSYNDVMNSIAKKIQELVFIDATLIRLINKEGTRLDIAAHSGLSEEYLNKGPIFIEKSPLDKETLSEGKPIVISHPAKDKRIQYPDKVGKEKVQAIISVTLKTCNHVLGVIRGYSFKNSKFSADQISLFQKLSAQAAIAIETFRSLERSKKLLEVSKKVNSSLDLGNVLHTTVQLAAESLKVKGSTIRIFNENTDLMELRAYWGISDDFILAGPSLLSERPIDQEVMQGKTIYIPDVTKDSRFRLADIAEKEGIVSTLCVPLEAMGRHIGTLRIYTAQIYNFSEEEMNFLQMIATQAGTAVNNALMFERIHRLLEVTTSLTQSLNKHDVFKKIVQGAAEATNAKGSAVLIWKESKSSFRVRAHHGIPEEAVFEIANKNIEEIKQFILNNRVVIKMTKSDNDDKSLLMKKLGIGSILMIPMTSKDHLTGALICFLSASRTIEPNIEEMDFYKALANAATIAIENARLYDGINKKYNEMVDDVFLWYDGTSKGMDF